MSFCLKSTYGFRRKIRDFIGCRKIRPPTPHPAQIGRQKSGVDKRFDKDSFIFPELFEKEWKL